MKITENQIRKLIRTMLLKEQGSVSIDVGTVSAKYASGYGGSSTYNSGNKEDIVGDDKKYPGDQALKTVSNLKPSDYLYKHLKGAEGYRGHVYDDKNSKPISKYKNAVGTPTIGYGHAIFKKGHNKYNAQEQEKYKKYLKGGQKMTKPEAEQLFRSDVERHTGWKTAIKVPITQ